MPPLPLTELAMTKPELVRLIIIDKESDKEEESMASVMFHSTRLRHNDAGAVADNNNNNNMNINDKMCQILMFILFKVQPPGATFGPSDANQARHLLVE